MFRCPNLRKGRFDRIVTAKLADFSGLDLWPPKSYSGL
jgi:hypothetical protein